MFSYRCFFLLVATAVSISEAFAPMRVPLQHDLSTAASTTRMSTTALQAAPILIIGPMIKKMREKEAEKNRPMADSETLAREAPGLRVGSETWKWPPVWPYDDAFFRPAAAEPAQSNQDEMMQMANMLSGTAQLPTTSVEAEEEEEEVRFDPLEYWNQQEVNTKTNLDAEAIEKLKAHYSFYLRDGMSILEFGAAEDSYLPDDIKPSRHVGVGASLKLMETNPSITETLQVDLNKVVKDRDIDNDDLRLLAQEPFDAIIMANTIDFLAHPREVFRSAWYLLKPGGIMLVPFSGKEATKGKFTEAQNKAWRDYNDDQHMWMTGSFFQFSASDGWENLLGFDISPASAKKANQSGLQSLLDQGKTNNMYVVQATKAYQDEGINPDNLERSIGSLCWMLPILEPREKGLVVPRLARAYETAKNDKVRESIERNIPLLPRIYEALVKMDTMTFTYPMQAQLATDLISDPGFTGSDDQILSLKQGLGLRTPTAEFWVPVGQRTANMVVEERISLLGYIVPRFGSGNPEQEEALQAFVTGLGPTYDVIRKKCPELDAADVELLGTELLATEVLTPGRSSREEFAAWMAALAPEELCEMLSSRKSVREAAMDELSKYKEALIEQQRLREEYTQKYSEQVQKAKEERSMYFNPKTQKMELLKQKK